MHNYCVCGFLFLKDRRIQLCVVVLFSIVKRRMGTVVFGWSVFFYVLIFSDTSGTKSSNHTLEQTANSHFK